MANQPKSYRKFLAGSVTAALVASAVAPAASAEEQVGPFPDVPANDPHAGNIAAAVDMGLVTGYDDGTFGPYQNISRGQVAKIIARYLGDVDTTDVEQFTDVAKSGDTDLHEAAKIVRAEGIFNGRNGELDFEQPISRQEMASVLVRLFGFEDLPEVDSTVTDNSDAYETHRANIDLLSEWGITTEELFNPTGAVKRAQFASFMIRSIDLLPASAVEEITVEDANHLLVKIAGDVTEVKPSDFQFDGGLEVTAAEIVPASAAEEFTFVRLTTTDQEPNSIYNLVAYKGFKVEEGEVAPVETPALLEVTEVSAIDATTISVTLSDETVHEVTLEEALVDGENEVTFEIEGVEYTATVAFDGTAPVVDNGEVVDYQTLALNLSEAVTGTPVVTVNGTEVEAALSEDGTQVVIAKEAGYTAGTYNVVVSGLVDAFGNELAETSVSVVKEASYVADFDVITTGLTNAADQVVYFDLFDQYGQEVTDSYTDLDTNFKVEGTMGSFPLDVSFDGAKPFVKIADTLTTSSVVNLTLSNEDKDGNVVGSTSVSYVVEKDITPKATTINSISTSKTTLTAGNPDVELTADIRDQFNNPVEDLTGLKLRWTTSDEKVVSLDGTKVTSKSSDGALGSNKITVDAVAEGTATINAYLPDGTKVVEGLTITVTQGDLATIDATSADVTVENNATLEKANVLVNPTQEQIDAGASYVEFKNEIPNVIGVKAADVNVKVTDSEGTEVTEEVSVEKVTDANGNLEGFKVTTDRTGQDANAIANNPSKDYVVELSVGEEKASFNLTSTIDTEAASVEVEELAANALTAGSTTVTQKVVFKNQYGEVIDVPFANVNVTASGGLTANVTDNKDGIADTITYNASGASAGSKTVLVTVSGTDASLSYSVDVVKAAELTSSTFGTATDALIAADASVFVPVSFADQYSNEFEVKASDIDGTTTKIVVEPKSSEQSADDLTVSLAKTVEDELVTGATGSDVVTGFEVSAGAAAKGTYTVKLVDGEDVIGSFDINVNEARVLNNVTVDQSTAKLALGGQKEIVITPVDQYGKVVAIAPTVSASTAGIVSGIDSVSEVKDAKTGALTGYKVTLTGETKGTTELTVSTVSGSITKTAKVNVSVDSVGSLVNSVSIDEADVKALHHTGETVDLAATSTDSAGNVVAVNPADYVWTVESVTKADGTAGDVADVTVDANGDVTFTAAYAGKAVIKVQSPNLKSDTVEINFSNAAKSAQMGTTAVKEVEGIVLDSDADTAGVQVALDGKGEKDGEEAGTIAFEIDALDQYAETIEINEANAIVTTDDSSVVTVGNVDGAITVSAKSEGTAKVFVQYNGDTLEFTFSVNEDAVAFAQEETVQAAAEEAIAALESVEWATADANAVATGETDASTAQSKVDAVTDATAKSSFQSRLDTEKNEISARKAELEAQAAAEEAIAALESVEWATADANTVATGETDAAAAQTKVDEVTDATAKSSFQSRLDTEKNEISARKAELAV
jgi:S-layer homology domain